MTSKNNEKITSRYGFEPGRFDHLRERAVDLDIADALWSWPINEAQLNNLSIEPEMIERLVVTETTGEGVTLVIPERLARALVADMDSEGRADD